MVAVVAVTVAMVGTSCSSGSPGTNGANSSGIPSPSIARVGQFPKGAAAKEADQKPVVPATGAYFGAWVQPLSYTQPGRENAVLGLESQLNRRLDIVHTYRRESESFPRTSDFATARQGSYLLLSWAIGSAPRIAAGDEDAFIRQRAREIRSFRAPIFLEFQWEMDRPNLAGVINGPAAYVAAWRRAHAIFGQMHVDNVAWVWCPTATGFADGRAQAYYPGDDEVDWTCVDAYPGPEPAPLGTVIAPFLTWAAQNGKPIMIGEFGINHNFPATERATWLAQAQTAIEKDPQIKAVVYFDSGARGTDPSNDFVFTDNPTVFQTFKKWADSDYFDVQRLLVR